MDWQFRRSEFHRTHQCGQIEVSIEEAFGRSEAKVPGAGRGLWYRARAKDLSVRLSNA